MTILIKIALYLLGALALLFVVAAPNKKQERLSITTLLTDNAVLLTATESEIAETAPAASTQKEHTAHRPLERPTVPESQPKLLAIPPPALPVAAQPASPLLPPTETAPTTTPVAAVEQAKTVSFDEINKRTRAALVNVLCTTLRSGSFEPLSGSGVIIDPRGVILTNAHVAEYFLLKDYLVPDFVKCIIRTGEPARNRYRAELLYISPLWVQANYKKIQLAEATGTGEHDFAFLLITESINQEALPLPEEFPALPMDFTDKALRTQNQVIAAGYPAGLLSGINIQKDLYPSSSVVTVGDVFTFREKTPDIFSVGGSVLAQAGASGGAIVSETGKLIGLIVTASSGATTGERNLNGITPSHIARSFNEDTGFALEQFLAGDFTETAKSFNTNVAPALIKLLEDEINR
jgi:S1-C subfamily serine protease